MAIKKKRTKAQLAATKKLVALNKKRAAGTKKKAVKKSPKKKVGRKSQVTKKAPSARLKARRAKPKKKGYFPNPISYIVGHSPKVGEVKFFFDGIDLTDIKRNAATFTVKKQAENVAANIKKIHGLRMVVIKK